MVLVAFALCACHKPPSAAGKRYQLDGVVVSVDPQGHIATIKGQKIEGWMDAMTMDYPVKDAAEFATLHPGDHIAATIYVDGLNYSIGEIHHLR